MKACLYDYDFVQEAGEVHTDPELDTYTNEELYGMLRERDPAQAEKIHINNRRRLLRSLTILRHTGIPQGEMVASQRHEMIDDAMIVGCTMERQKLHERIALRVRQMAAEGLEDEVRALAEKYGFRAPGMQGIGYKEWEAYFAGEISREEVIEKIIVHSRQYARRQYTWLNHQMPVHWFDSTDPQDAERMRKEIGEWIRDCRE